MLEHRSPKSFDHVSYSSVLSEHGRFIESRVLVDRGCTAVGRIFLSTASGFPQCSAPVAAHCVAYCQLIFEPAFFLQGHLIRLFRLVAPPFKDRSCLVCARKSATNHVTRPSRTRPICRQRDYVTLNREITIVSEGMFATLAVVY